MKADEDTEQRMKVTEKSRRKKEPLRVVASGLFSRLV